MMELSYDVKADAAYIRLSTSEPGQVNDTYTCEELPTTVKGDINLDFDHDGLLCGVEILYASKVLPKKLLEQAN